jgi:FkbM family methyltransferase
MRLTKRSLRGVGLNDCVISFLCGGMACVGVHRKSLQDKFARWLDRFASGEDVSLRFRLNGRVVCLLMRKGNRADYLIGGEMVWDTYVPPQTMPTSIVDGGANIGMFTIWAHAWFPDVPVICYEPDTANLRQLERNLKINKISAKVIPKGLWSSNITLYYHPGLSSTGYVDETSSEYPIVCTTPEISEGCWLKLDIEGAEYEVLPKVLGQAAKPSFISMEIHHNKTRGITLVRQLADVGYILLRPHKTTFNCVNIEARRVA